MRRTFRDYLTLSVLLTAVACLPHPGPEAEHQARDNPIIECDKDGCIILGDPSSWTHWSPPKAKRGADEPIVSCDDKGCIILGDPDSWIHLYPPKSKRDSKPDEPLLVCDDKGCYSLGPFHGWTKPPTKREADPPTLTFHPPGKPPITVTLPYSLSNPTETIIWGRDAKANPDPVADAQLSTPTSDTTFPGDDTPIGDNSFTMVFPPSPTTTTAEPPLGSPSSSISWGKKLMARSVEEAANIFDERAVTCTDVGCECDPEATPGRYCGGCDAVNGNWVSWNLYLCRSGGKCCSYGYRGVCATGTGDICGF